MRLRGREMFPLRSYFSLSLDYNPRGSGCLPYILRAPPPACISGIRNILCPRCKGPQASLNGKQLGQELLEGRRQCTVEGKGRAGSKSRTASQFAYVHLCRKGEGPVT